jgi:FKBP-type peptidyl-prolyl cis-trans isomerase (trigger factor)
MYSIARKDNISLSDEEYKNKVADYAKKAGFDSVSAMEKSYSKSDIKMNMLMEKVIDYVTGLSVEVK